MSDAERCQNCDEALTGPYCAACGQKQVDLTRGFLEVLADAFGEAFEVDGRLHRTAVPFLLRPGELPRLWAEGKRAPFTSPVRVFVFALFVGFVGLQLIGEGWAELVPADPLAFDDQGHADVHLVGDGTVQMDIEAAEGRAGLPATQRALALAVLDHMVDNGPTAVALMVPLFAVGLQLVLWRRRLVDHLVFSLFHHSRLLLLAGVLLPLVGGWGIPIVWAVVNLYLVLGLRRAYELERWGTAWRSVLLVGAHTLALATLLVGVLAWSAVAVIQDAGDIEASE